MAPGITRLLNRPIMILQGSKIQNSGETSRPRTEVNATKYECKTVYASRHCYPVASPPFPFETPNLWYAGGGSSTGIGGRGRAVVSTSAFPSTAELPCEPGRAVFEISVFICGDADGGCVCREVGDIPADFESRMGLSPKGKPVCRAGEDSDMVVWIIGPAPLVCIGWSFILKGVIDCPWRAHAKMMVSWRIANEE